MIGATDFEYLLARLGGRSALLAEGHRLEALCGLHSPAELGDVLFPGAGLSSAAEIQRRLVADLVGETCEVAAGLTGIRARLAWWLAARYQLTNLKIAVRSLCSGAFAQEARRLLVPLPPALEGFGPEMLEDKTPEMLIATLPLGPLREQLAQAWADHPDRGRPFFLEAALDRAWLKELLARSTAQAAGDRAFATALARQEIAAFDLLLAARGRFFYGLGRAELLALYAGGSRVDQRRFAAMLDAPDVGSLRALAAGTAVDSGPPEPDPTALEALTRARRAKLARRALRGGHATFGAVLGYLALRRVEAANLVTVSEGLRLGLPARELVRRMTPWEHAEARHA